MAILPAGTQTLLEEGQNTMQSHCHNAKGQLPQVRAQNYPFT